jgi:hypothetical protein
MAVDLTPVRPAKLGVRVDHDPLEDRKFIWRNGLSCQWEMAGQCPCGQRMTVGGLSGDLRERKVSCTACRGTGIIYHSAQPVPLLVVTPEVNPERFKLWGEHAQGRVSLTFLPEHLPSLFDRVTILQSVLLFRERIKRTAADVDRLRYPVATRTVGLGTGVDQAVAVPTELSVIHCRVADATGTIVAGERVRGVDFEIDDDGNVDWSLGDIAGTAPAVGSYASFSYYTHPVYLVTSLPFGYRDTMVGAKATGVTQHGLAIRVSAELEILGGTREAQD